MRDIHSFNVFIHVALLITFQFKISCFFLINTLLGKHSHSKWQNMWTRSKQNRNNILVSALRRKSQSLSVQKHLKAHRSGLYALQCAKTPSFPRLSGHHPCLSLDSFPSSCHAEVMILSYFTLSLKGLTNKVSEFQNLILMKLNRQENKTNHCANGRSSDLNRRHPRRRAYFTATFLSVPWSFCCSCLRGHKSASTLVGLLIILTTLLWAIRPRLPTLPQHDWCYVLLLFKWGEIYKPS